MSVDYTKPVEIAEDVYWVGHVLEKDPFQCHVYLIKNGKDSILIDPGSKLTWPETRKKVEMLIPLHDIKYFICHHQDPDITACMEDIFKEIGTKGRYVVTHWRTKALLVHYNWGVQFLEVEENNYRLKAGKRDLEFIFTPYMHFPGNICTYDVKTKTLFSSDIFGAFTEEFSLFAKNAHDYFEQMKLLHEHYMPSNEIAKDGIEKIERYEVNLIAPQHGSIIKKEFIPYIIEKAKNIDVGLFRSYGAFKNLRKLSKANGVISKIAKMVVFESNVQEKMDVISVELRAILPIDRIVAVGYKHIPVLFDSSLYKPIELNIDYREMVDFCQRFGIGNSFTPITIKESLFGYRTGTELNGYATVANDYAGTLFGILIFVFEAHTSLSREDFAILQNLKPLLEAILNKELDWYTLESEKNELFEKSIRDGLTGLFNRYYFNMAAEREFFKAVRYGYPLSLAFLDIDRFKNINDRYGHLVGDAVLMDFGKLILTYTREFDLAFRYGGDEFVVLFPHTLPGDACRVIHRIKERLSIKGGLKVSKEIIDYTFSAGVVGLRKERNINELTKKADEKAYQAKLSGRNKIVC